MVAGKSAAMLSVYTTRACAYCPLVKRFLQFKDVEYQEIDVSSDADKRSELFNLTGLMTVPVTTKGDKFVVGWKPAELAQLIA